MKQEERRISRSTCKADLTAPNQRRICCSDAANSAVMGALTLHSFEKYEARFPWAHKVSRNVYPEYCFFSTLPRVSSLNSWSVGASLIHRSHLMILGSVLGSSIHDALFNCSFLGLLKSNILAFSIDILFVMECFLSSSLTHAH